MDEILQKGSGSNIGNSKIIRDLGKVYSILIKFHPIIVETYFICYVSLLSKVSRGHCAIISEVNVYYRDTAFG